MSIYTQGIVGAEKAAVKPEVSVQVNTAKVGDNFWTAVKWIGGALTLIVGYREAKYLWRKHLRGEEDEREAEEESAEE